MEATAEAIEKAFQQDELLQAFQDQISMDFTDEGLRVQVQDKAAQVLFDSGSATLKPNPEFNPQGPTTLTAIVDTGSGSIMSTIFGQVTTLDKQCTFMPTIGSSVVP